MLLLVMCGSANSHKVTDSRKGWKSDLFILFFLFKPLKHNKKVIVKGKVYDTGREGKEGDTSVVRISAAFSLFLQVQST